MNTLMNNIYISINILYLTLKLSIYSHYRYLFKASNENGYESEQRRIEAFCGIFFTTITLATHLCFRSDSLDFNL